MKSQFTFFFEGCWIVCSVTIDQPNNFSKLTGLEKSSLFEIPKQLVLLNGLTGFFVEQKQLGPPSR